MATRFVVAEQMPEGTERTKLEALGPNVAWCEQVKAFVVRLGYDAATGVGRLKAIGWTDQAGTVALFSAIDPDVEAIEVRHIGITDGKSVASTVYRKRDDGTWAAEVSDPLAAGTVRVR